MIKFNTDFPVSSEPDEMQRLRSELELVKDKLKESQEHVEIPRQTDSAVKDEIMRKLNTLESNLAKSAQSTSTTVASSASDANFERQLRDLEEKMRGHMKSQSNPPGTRSAVGIEREPYGFNRIQSSVDDIKESVFSKIKAMEQHQLRSKPTTTAVEVTSKSTELEAAMKRLRELQQMKARFQ